MTYAPSNRPALAVFGLLLAATPLAAGQATLTPLKDNTIYNDLTGGISNGMGEYLFAGRNSGMAAYPIRRALIAFDVASAVPAGAQITSAQLVLSLSQTSSGPQTVSLHRLSKDWGEGASDAPGNEGAGDAAKPGDATWLHTFFNTTTWTVPGGDYSLLASASTSVDQVGFYTFGSSAGMVADVQTWLDTPAQNFGWIVRGNESVVGSAKRFDSAQSAFSSLRPQLIVDYSVGGSTVYCTAKVTSGGCTPSISSTGSPSFSGAGSFSVVTTQVEPSVIGLQLYGNTGQNATAFQGGILCVHPPVKRTPPKNSGAGGPCGGVFQLDANALIAAHTDPWLSAGATIDIQSWFRDPPASFGTGLSNGLEFVIGP